MTGTIHVGICPNCGPTENTENRFPNDGICKDCGATLEKERVVSETEYERVT